MKEPRRKNGPAADTQNKENLKEPAPNTPPNQKPRPKLSVETLEPRILLSATWVGTDGADEFNGTAGADVAEGLDGDDLLRGGNQDDVLIGGAGDDQLYGDNHADTLLGGEGDDQLFGGNHNDLLDGGTGDDQLFGGLHNDTLISGGGNDYLDGGMHDDVFRFDGAQDGDVITVVGGHGNDTIDLSGYTQDQLSDDGSTIHVNMGEGQSFTINYSGIETIIDGGPGAADPDDDGAGGAEVETVYLRSDGYPIATTSEDAPTDPTLDNHDPGRDSFDGLMIQKGGSGIGETDHTKYQSWVTTFPDGAELDGDAQLTIWSAMKDFNTTKGGTIDVYLLDTNASGGDATVIAQTELSRDTWSPDGGWTEDAIDFGDVDHTIEPGRALTIKIVVDSDSDDDMWFAYDSTSHQSRLEFGVPSAADAPPEVDAGPDQVVSEGDVVTLAGSGIDADGQSLTYEWVQTAGPTVTLNDPHAASPTFTAPEGVTNTDVAFELRVSDGTNTSIDTVTVTVNADDDAPSADAGPDVVVQEGDLVTLTGAGSDVEGQDLAFEWVQTAGPTVTLSDPHAASPTFTAPQGSEDTDVAFELRVSDGTHTSVDTVTVTIHADENDAFAFETPTAGAVYHVDGGAGSDSIDLRNFSRDDATFDNGTITVDLGNGESFAVEHAGIESVTFADADVRFVVWDGGGATGEAADAANWAGDTLPDADDIVVFDGTSAKDAVLGNLTVGGLQIADGYGGDVTLSGDLVVDGDLVIESGTFSAGNHDLRVDGDLRIEGGKFTASEGTTELTGDLVVDGGTFKHNGGTFEFSGGGDQSIRGGGATLSLDNLTVNKSDGTLTIHDGVRIGGNYINSAGLVDASEASVEFAGHNVTVLAGDTTFGDVTFDASGNTTISGTMDINGDLEIERLGNLNGGEVRVAGNVTTTDSSYGGSAAIVLDGSGGQLISAGGGTGELHHLTVDKSDGAVTLHDRIELSGDYALVAGSVDASGATVEFQGHNANIAAGDTAFGNVIFDASGNTTINGTMDINGELTIERLGNLNGGEVRVAGNVTTGDTKFGGNATIVLDGTGDQSLTASGAVGEMHNLSIDKPGGTLILTGHLEMTGNFTHVDGNVDASDATVEFQGHSATIDAGSMIFGDVILDGSGNTTVVGVLDVDGSLTIEKLGNLNGGEVRVAGDVITGDTKFGGNATIVLDGDGDQSLTASGAVGEMHNLSIDKAGGVTTITGHLELTGNFTHANGNVDASGATVEFQGHNATIHADGFVFGDLVLDTTGTTTFEGDMIVTGDLTIERLSTFNGGTIYVGGELNEIDAKYGGTAMIVLGLPNHAPDAVGESFETAEDTPVTTGNVLANDGDPDGHELSVVSFTQPNRGTVVYHNDGTFTYTPESNFNGTDTFTYTVSDGNGGSDTATIIVHVGAVNDAPSADAGADLTIEEGHTVQLTGGGTDVDNQDLTYEWVQIAGPEVTLDDPHSANPTFTAPAVEANAEVRFELRVSDGTSTAVDMVSVTVLATTEQVSDADQPPVDPPTDDVFDPEDSAPDTDLPVDTAPDDANDDAPIFELPVNVGPGLVGPSGGPSVEPGPAGDAPSDGDGGVTVADGVAPSGDTSASGDATSEPGDAPDVEPLVGVTPDDAPTGDDGGVDPVATADDASVTDSGDAEVITAGAGDGEKIDWGNVDGDQLRAQLRILDGRADDITFSNHDADMTALMREFAPAGEVYLDPVEADAARTARAFGSEAPGKTAADVFDVVGLIAAGDAGDMGHAINRRIEESHGRVGRGMEATGAELSESTVALAEPELRALPAATTAAAGTTVDGFFAKLWSALRGTAGAIGPRDRKE